MKDHPDQSLKLNGKAEPPQIVEPVSDVALEARSETKDAEIVDLNARLAQVHDKTGKLAAQEQELTDKLAAAVEKTHELHTKIVAAKNDLGGES